VAGKVLQERSPLCVVWRFLRNILLQKGGSFLVKYVEKLANLSRFDVSSWQA
jgi:hypothetical protein